MRSVELVRINKVGDDYYIVTYDMVSECGCSRSRDSIEIRSEVQPDDDYIISLIETKEHNK